MKKQREWLHPHGASRDYQRMLLYMIRSVNGDIKEFIFPALPGLVQEGSIRQDGFMEDLSSLMRNIRASVTNAVNVALRGVSSIFNKVNSFNARQFDMTVRQMTGIAPLNYPEPWMGQMKEQWIAENARLIRSIPANHLDEMEGIILRSMQEGTSADELKRRIQKRFGISENRARLIAYDQVSKANSVMVQNRLSGIGVKRYRWRTRRDDRVRPEHAEREGKIYVIGKAPAGGPPGWAVRCRCWAEGIFDNNQKG